MGKYVLCSSGSVNLTQNQTTNTMAAIWYAYQAFYDGVATPTQLYQVGLADATLGEVDKIRDMTNPANRRRLRILAEKMYHNYMNDGGDSDLNEAIIQSYMDDTVENHTELLGIVENLATPPDPM
jgi:hypothetical protein